MVEALRGIDEVRRQDRGQQAAGLEERRHFIGFLLARWHLALAVVNERSHQHLDQIRPPAQHFIIDRH